MGLCPQFDTLIDALSVRENLHMFAYLKGIEPRSIKSVCESFMNALNIKMYERNLIQELSGGNRRKVSLAVALLGNPPSVYLDEPSTGLDPIACRYMWRLLSKLSATGSSAMILTTHNMLECQAVCSKVGIMKNGELVALGDSQHLRNVHGVGYMLEISSSSTDEAVMTTTLNFVGSSFSGAVVVDRHGAMINFEIPRGVIKSLAEAFEHMENNKKRLNITDYSLSQSTLEQVFMKAIRMTRQDLVDLAAQREAERKSDATCSDYCLGHLAWFLGIIPFCTCLFHCMLGNFLTACIRFWTLNWFVMGCILDGTVLNLIIQDAVHAKGHLTCHCKDCCVFFCRCCACFWCCCCRYGWCASSKQKTNPDRRRTAAGGVGNGGVRGGAAIPLQNIVITEPGVDPSRRSKPLTGAGSLSNV
jgi:ABC-type multidrug transport system ATPase subunit